MKTVSQMKQESEVPVVMADQEGFITYVNERFEAIFGWSSEEIIGKPLTTIIPGTLHDAHHLGFSRFLTTGKPTVLDRPLKLKAVNKGGKIFDAEHFIVAEQSNGRWVFASTIHPL